jgi:sulfotransferase family protein
MPPMSSARPSVVFIASLPHSGSTLLDLLLGSHSQIEGLGEISKLKRYAEAAESDAEHGKKQKCTCGAASIWRCPHWSKVELALRRRNSSLRNLDLASTNRRRFRQDNGLLYAAVSAAAGKRFVVDSSKSVTRLKMLLQADAFDLYPVFLYRQPHGQINSMIKKYGDPERALSDNLRANTEFLDVLQGRSFVAVRYEDLAADAAQTLLRVLTPLGLPFEERQLEWARLPHHNLAGNSMRFSGNGALREDDSWRRMMGPELIDRVDRAIAKLESRIAECM